MIKFSKFYNWQKEQRTPEQLSYKISEEDYNRLLNLFELNHKYLVDQVDFKNDWGYGKEYLLKNQEHLILINRFKDEFDNKEAIIIVENINTFRDIQNKFKIGELT